MKLSKDKKFILVIFSLFLTYLLAYAVSCVFFPASIITQQKQLPENAPVIFDNFTSIKQFHWVDNENLYINADNTLYRLDVNTRESTEITKLNENRIFGIENGNLIFCEYYNYEIDSPEKIASEFIVYNKDGAELLRFQSTNTIAPITCGSKSMYAKNAYPFLEEKYYTIDLAQKKLEEIEMHAAFPISYRYEDSKTIFEEGLNRIGQTNYFPDISMFELSNDKSKVAIMTGETLVMQKIATE